jgi:hypothetical protein
MIDLNGYRSLEPVWSGTHEPAQPISTNTNNNFKLRHPFADECLLTQSYGQLLVFHLCSQRSS